MRISTLLPVAFLPAIALAQESEAQEVKISPPLPHQDTEFKEPWTPPLKPGSTFTENSHLSAVERAELDRALDRSRVPHAEDRDEAAPKELIGPTLPASQLLPRVTGTGREHFQLDVGPGGALWAYGGTYKARFDPSGAQYVPFFGASAPRNFPVDIQLSGISLGGDPLAFAGGVAPQFEDRTVVFDRGSVEERYDLAVGSMEQLFVFDSLPGHGELVVRMNVVSELVGASDEGAIEFSGDFGSVRYGRATVLDDAGRAELVPTSYIDGQIVIRVPATFVAEAQFPLTIDPVVSTFSINNDPSDDDSAPDVAYDQDNARYLVCWQRVWSATDRDVWAELRGTTGGAVAGSGAYIDFTTSDWTRPAVANNRIAEQFLVVAERGVYPDTDIYGRTREASSNSMGSQFQISSGSGDKRNPDVGGDPHTIGPTYYCVVWERAFNIGVDHDVHARLVRSNGSLVGTSAVLIDNSGSTYDKYPRVSNSNGIPSAASQRWNIVWQRQFSSSDWDIRGAQVTWSGNITSSSFSVDFSSRDDRFPVASSPLDYQADDARLWMAAYRRDNPSDYDIEATVWRGDTYINDGTLSSMGSGSGQDQYEPDIDSNGKHFTVSWSELFGSSTTDRDVYAGSFYVSGNQIHASESHVNLAFSSDVETQVRGFARHSSALSSDWIMYVWRDGAFGDGDIEGAVYELPDHYGNDIAENYCGPATVNSSGSRAVMHASGSAVAGGEPLNLSAFNLPPNQFAMFSGTPNGTSMFNPPGNQGTFCLGQPYGRFNRPGEIVNSGSNGRIDLHIDTTDLPLFPAVPALAGQTWRFQAWFRDQNPGSTSNFSDAVAVLFH